MRLSSYEKESIKSAFKAVFGDGKVYLFGSRADDVKKGGDIDLYIEVSDKENLFSKKIKFLASIKKNLGEQKIDVVFNEDSQRLIEQEAIRCAVAL